MPKLSKEKMDEKKNLILDISFELFARKGYASTGMRDIMKKTNMSKGGIYVYFNSKEEILLGLIKRMDKKKRANINPLSDKVNMMDYFKDYMTARLKSFQEEETRKWVRISTTFWSEEENIDSLKLFDQERYDNYRYDIEQILIKGIEQKEFSNGLDLESTIYQIMSAIDGVSVLSCLMNKIITDEQIESTVNMYANYLKGD